MTDLLMAALRDRLDRIRLRRSRTPFARHYRRIAPYTMCSVARLRGLHEAVTTVVTDGIDGALVECGVARGGSAALMGLTARAWDDARLLVGYDTWRGMPAPGPYDPPAAWRWVGRCRATQADVEQLWQALDLWPWRTVRGDMTTTLARPYVLPDRIAVLHVDCDWYESVRVVLDTLYDRLSPGGIVQIDDYGHWSGCRHAVDAFREGHGITTPMRVLDYAGRQWRHD